MNYCEQCGGPITSNANFCSKCGTKLKSIEGIPDSTNPLRKQIKLMNIVLLSGALSLTIGGTLFVNKVYFQETDYQENLQLWKDPTPKPTQSSAKPKPQPTAKTRWCNVLSDQEIFFERQRIAELMEKLWEANKRPFFRAPNDPYNARLNLEIEKSEKLINRKEKC